MRAVVNDISEIHVRISVTLLFCYLIVIVPGFLEFVTLLFQIVIDRSHFLYALKLALEYSSFLI